MDGSEARGLRFAALALGHLRAAPRFQHCLSAFFITYAHTCIYIYIYVYRYECIHLYVCVCRCAIVCDAFEECIDVLVDVCMVFMRASFSARALVFFLFFGRGFMPSSCLPDQLLQRL